MTRTIVLTGRTAAAGSERRRSGRSPYSNPHLIALLRQSAPAGTEPTGTELADPAPKAAENTRLRGTISLFDGASQMGTPHRSCDPADEDRLIWDGPFLANQVSYVKGVRIACTRGTIRVEHLAVGDVVLTLSGQRTVKWLRAFDLRPAEGPHPERTAPVLVRRDAIARGLPGRDVWVSPTHCLWIAGCLVPARRLLNGMTIVQDIAAVQVDYRHVLFDLPVNGRPLVLPEQTLPVWASLAERAAGLGFASVPDANLAESRKMDTPA